MHREPDRHQCITYKMTGSAVSTPTKLLSEDFRSWLDSEVRVMSPVRLLYPSQQTFERRSPVGARFLPVHSSGR